MHNSLRIDRKEYPFKSHFLELKMGRMYHVNLVSYLGKGGLK